MKIVLFVIIAIISLTNLATAQSLKGNKMTNNPKVKIVTTLGTMIMELLPEKAPLHADNFEKLVRKGFFNGTSFHRVIPNFMIQGGDPNSKNENRSTHGMGGPGYTIPAEISLNNVRGSVAAARQGDQVNPKRESSGSQFYINVVDNKFLDGQYTVFAKIIEGMDVADKISSVARDPRDNPIDRIEISMQMMENE